MTTAPNIPEAVQHWEDLINEHDLAGFGATYAPDAVVVDPQYPEPLRGREAIEKDMGDIVRAFGDIRIHFTRTYVHEYTVINEWGMRGTHTGPLDLPSGTVEPTNRTVEFEGCAVSEIDADGLVATQRRYYDLLGQMSQLGILGQ